MHKIRKMLKALPDPRAPNALHDLLDVIIIALATVLCGGRGATDMETFASSKEKLLRQFLRLEHGIPSHDTFGRVLNALDPEAFERTFRGFMAAFAEANGIAIPCGCRAGSCGTCQVAVFSGEVAYTEKSDFETTPGTRLTCIGTPRSDVVLDA